MMDIFTGFALVGAAISTAAWAVAAAKLRIENGKWTKGNEKCRMENVELRNVSHLTGKEQIRHSPFSILNSKFSLHTAVHTVDRGAGYWFAVIGNLKEYEDCPRIAAAIPREMPDGTDVFRLNGVEVTPSGN